MVAYVSFLDPFRRYIEDMSTLAINPSRLRTLIDRQQHIALKRILHKKEVQTLLCQPYRKSNVGQELLNHSAQSHNPVATGMFLEAGFRPTWHVGAADLSSFKLLVPWNIHPEMVASAYETWALLRDAGMSIDHFFMGALMTYSVPAVQWLVGQPVDFSSTRMIDKKKATTPLGHVWFGMTGDLKNPQTMACCLHQSPSLRMLWALLEAGADPTIPVNNDSFSHTFQEYAEAVGCWAILQAITLQAHIYKPCATSRIRYRI